MSGCRETRDVDAHFAGRLHPSDEHRMRAHLVECETCRGRYQARLVLARIDPAARSVDERLGRGLGLWRARPRWSLFLGAPLAIGACALVLMLARPSGDAGFTARGGGAAAELDVYRVPAAGRPVRLERELPRGDALAFAYRNPGGRSHLLLFAVDEHRHVQWFYPRWSDAKEDPTALPIRGRGESTELPEAISVALDGKKLRVTAWFLDEPMHVTAAERAIATGARPAGVDEVARDVELGR